jgi:UDP-N-acetylmuramoyl-tripeptide--D-alanyl-D-alanine ligase
MTRPLWTIGDLLAESDGRLFADGRSANTPVTGIKIDSRECGVGDLFVALSGGQRDGHEFLQSAAVANAAAALVKSPDRNANIAQIIVNDSLTGLTRLANAGRRRFSGKMIGITGSVGKTGSKDLLAHALSRLGRTHANKHSFNNHIGVPLSLATLPADYDFAVQEIGMNRSGEIAALTAITRPNVALVTRVAGTHSAFFKSIDEIAIAKAEIFEGLISGGIGVLNRDDDFFPMLSEAAKQAGASRIITFGRHCKSEFCLLGAEQIQNGMLVRAKIGGNEICFKLRMHGVHWAQNALGVLACVAALDLPIDAAAESLVDSPTPKGRGLRHHGTYEGLAITLIDDSYNASPASMSAAFASMAASPPNIMVLSEMLELGDATTYEHDALISQINALAPRLVIGLGTELQNALSALDKNITFIAAKTSQDALQALNDAIEDTDVVFVKGSHGSGAWRVLDAILDRISPFENTKNGSDSHAA